MSAKATIRMSNECLEPQPPSQCRYSDPLAQLVHNNVHNEVGCKEVISYLYSYLLLGNREERQRGDDAAGRDVFSDIF